MKIEIPTTCPACGHELELVNDQLFCKNTTCPAQSSKKLIHFAKTMQIKGLGEKTLEKLEVDGISNLYNFQEFELVDKLGEKIGTKIYNEIQKSAETTLSRFLASMSIPLIGKTAADKVETVISDLKDLSSEACKKAGLGPKATENLMNWFNNEYEDIKNLPVKFEEGVTVESGKVVCISGKIPGHTKATLTELLADYNVTVIDNVTKKLDYLITEETNTSKVKKAEQYNINIISFDKFMEMIENE